MHRILLTAALLWSAMPGRAAAEVIYGGSAGAAFPLAPFEQIGVTASLSAVMDELESGPSGLLRLRGEVIGIWSQNGSAIMPTLSGDIGPKLGPVDLFLTGGLQIFGFSWRDDFTLFSTIGVLGGGGLGVQITPRFRLELRGIVTYLPEPTTAKMKQPEGGEMPTMLFVTTHLGLVFTPGSTSGPPL